MVLDSKTYTFINNTCYIFYNYFKKSNMSGNGFRRLKQGATLNEIIRFLIEKHPDGLKRSEIQDMLKKRLNIGESTGGVNRHLKKLRETALIDWDQGRYRYTLPSDYDSKEYFIRVVETLGLSTDKSYFLAMDMKPILSDATLVAVDDYIGFRYDEEMNENIMKLQDEYKTNEIHVHEEIKKLLKSHNSYVRLRLFKTTNECFLNDINRLKRNTETEKLKDYYINNINSIQKQMRYDIDKIFEVRERLIAYLNEKRLSKRMKFLIRFSLNHVRPSHIYDGMI